jgi:hypothetical protein
MRPEFVFNYYAKKDKAFFPIKEQEMPDYSAKGFDIFWTPQEFKSFGVRKVEDLKSLRYICADFDHITKEDLAKRIDALPRPTFVVSTRGGFHVYWELDPWVLVTPSTHEAYKEFVQTRLVHLGADRQAVDVARVLRVPFMRYWCDSKGNRYENVEIYSDIVFESDKRISWEKAQKSFPKKPEVKVQARARPAMPVFPGSETFWTKANNIPIRQGLEILSGRPQVNSEVFSFKAEGPKRTRILVAGRSINAWIDDKDQIGSTDEAGPKIPNWLYYYQPSWPAVAQALKDVFGL